MYNYKAANVCKRIHKSAEHPHNELCKSFGTEITAYIWIQCHIMLKLFFLYHGIYFLFLSQIPLSILHSCMFITSTSCKWMAWHWTTGCTFTALAGICLCVPQHIPLVPLSPLHELVHLSITVNNEKTKPVYFVPCNVIQVNCTPADLLRNFSDT